MLRYIKAFALAFIITAGLFLGMRYLILGGNAELKQSKPGAVMDFVRLKKDETVQQKKRKPKKPPKPKEPPPDAPQPQMDSQDMAADGEGIGFAADVGVDGSLEGGLALGSGDGEYLPIVKVQPIYPRRAQSRGIEGYVIVEFTVSKTGAVVNPIVVESEPEGIFDQAAKDAAKKFKYKPRVVDGTPIEVAGVQNKITFKIKR